MTRHGFSSFLHKVKIRPKWHVASTDSADPEKDSFDLAVVKISLVELRKL
jgi:hypothetical protein